MIEYEYKGDTYSLPNDLVALQVEIVRADASCRAAVEAEDGAALAIAREERLRLVTEKYRRAGSWWAAFQGSDRWNADWALQAYARSVLEGGATSGTDR